MTGLGLYQTNCFLSSEEQCGSGSAVWILHSDFSSTAINCAALILAKWLTESFIYLYFAANPDVLLTSRNGLYHPRGILLPSVNWTGISQGI